MDLIYTQINELLYDISLPSEDRVFIERSLYALIHSENLDDFYLYLSQEEKNNPLLVNTMYEIIKDSESLNNYHTILFGESI